jgi:phosphate transport system protein
MKSIIEDEIVSIEKLLKEMVFNVIEMHIDARFAMEKNDTEIATRIIKRDEIVNNLDEMINEQSLALLATQAPVAKDLRTTIATIRMATDLERIGDYAKVIAQFIIVGQKIPPRFKAHISRMYEVFMSILQESTALFFNPDIKKIYEVVARDQLIDAELKQAFAVIEAALAETDDPATILNSFNIMRTLERAGDHGKNICEAAIFKVKGKKIDLG